MTMKFTAVFEKVQAGYIAFVEELPGANAQGATLGRHGQTYRRLSSWCLRQIVLLLKRPSIETIHRSK